MIPRRRSSRKKVAIVAAVPQLVVHVFVVKICSEQIYGVFLCFVVTGTAKSRESRVERKNHVIGAFAPNDLPICSNFSASLLLARSSVHGNNLCSSSFNHLRILQSCL